MNSVKSILCLIEVEAIESGHFEVWIRRLRSIPCGMDNQFINKAVCRFVSINHIAWAEKDRYGNMLRCGSICFDLEHKNALQRKYIIQNIVDSYFSNRQIKL